MIDRILERFQNARVAANVPSYVDYWSFLTTISKCEEIVQEVAKEYGKDTSNEEFCEWRFEEGTPWVWHCEDDKCNSYNSIFKQDLNEVLEQFECKCPYCKKRIKVGGVLHED